jgi:subtilisin family serine protease
VDYGNVSDIIIAAGATTGTATFNPTADTVNEGDETATISISSVSGADSSTSGTTSVNIIINEYALNTGTQLTYNSSNATTLAATNEFGDFNDGAVSIQNPLEVINAHKAYGYGLTGSGETIAILDSGFYNSHDEFNNKTITTYGTVDAATGLSIGTDHGLFVSSVAAGEVNGSSSGFSGMQGVAPSASLHISDYSELNGNTYYPTHWANATDNASSAVVQNNSWGVDYQIDTLQSDISSNGLTNAYGMALAYIQDGFTANEASVNTYITALDNFQDHGVIVYALSNISSYTDADISAALPVLFSQLAEAWITAVNVEITGSSGSETYTRKSAPCGSTAEYCLGADGWEVTGAAYDINGSDYYWTEASGTSFVAPQISGAVALLSEAFPAHTPEQLTDRLLASADNSFFTHTGGVTFGNGVEHGYDTEFGHGIMDIYAALNPITTSAYTRLYTGESNQSSLSYSLGSSKISTSRSFGDALIRGLNGEIGYAYDALSGGFKYDMTTRIDISNNDAPTIDLTSELSKLDSSLSLANLSWKDDFSQVLSKLSETDKLETSLTVGASTLPVQSFFGSNFDSSINLNDYETPYLESGEGGIGLGATYQLGDSRLLVGITNPINQSNDNVIGLRKSLVASLEYGNPSDSAITIMAGITQDEGNLLGSTGNDAYSLSGSKSNTTFTAFKAQTQLGRNLSLTGIATLANTSMTRPSNSFINSASNVKSTSFSLIANKRNLFGDDNVSFFISQPNRVDNGRLSIRLSNLAGSDGSLTYRNKSINLEPTASQLDYGLSYRKDLDEDISFSIKHMVTSNLNHEQDSDDVSSSFIGARYKNLKVGLATNPIESQTNAELSYSYKF